MFNTYESIKSWGESQLPVGETETELFNLIVDTIDHDMKLTWDGTSCTSDEDAGTSRILSSLNPLRKANLLAGIVTQYLVAGWDATRVNLSPGYQWQLVKHV